jgi:hypothetical protein
VSRKVSLINLTKNPVAKLAAVSPISSEQKSEQEEMTRIRDRLLNNPYGDSDSVRTSLVALQNDLLFKKLSRIESALLTKYESSKT